MTGAKVLVAAPGNLPVTHVVAPALQHARRMARLLDGHGSVLVTLQDEHRHVQQSLGTGERGMHLAHEQLHGPRGRGIGVRVAIGDDAVVPAAEHRRRRGETLRMTRGEQPGTVAAHGFTRDVHAIVVDPQLRAGFVQAAQHVTLAHPAIVDVAAGHGLEHDEIVALGHGVVPLGDRPPALVARIQPVVAVQVDQRRRRPVRRVPGR